jgi:UDP-glucuronate 4-epimerase
VRVTVHVLVTGGAGFIGSHLCERLLKEGATVSIIDDLNDYYPAEWKHQNLASIGLVGTVRFLRADIADEEAVSALVKSVAPDAIVHLAARSGVRPSVHQPLLYERTNIRGTLVLLEAARRHAVRKFIFASSSSVYGISARSPFREDDPLTLPISPYAATKIAGEKICYAYSHLYDISIICLRLFTVYGPRQRPDLAIRKFTDRICHDQPITVFGDGTTCRDYTFIDDIVEGILAAFSCRSSFDVFNLGSSQMIRLSLMIETIETFLGKRAIIDWNPEQPGDLPATCADISKARQALGYAPKTGFAEGIQTFVDWYVRAARTR